MKNYIPQYRTGFTLVELIVVLVILAILAAILVPTFVGYIYKAEQGVYMVNARSAINAAQCVALEEYAKGRSFDSWRGFYNITDGNVNIQNRIYELSEIDKTKFVVANVDINEKGQLIFVNLYSKKLFAGKPNRLVYINGTVGGKAYNRELIITCWNGVEYYAYKSLDPSQVGYSND